MRRSTFADEPTQVLGPFGADEWRGWNDAPDSPVIPDSGTSTDRPVRAGARQRASRARRRTGPAHRGQATPIPSLVWVGLAACLGIGVYLLGGSRSEGLNLIGFVMLMVFVPGTLVAFVLGIQGSFGSKKLALAAGLFCVLALLRLSYFLPS